MRRFLGAAVAAGLLVAASGGAQAAKLKVCWVYPGPHNDGGFSQQHDIGRLDVVKALGDKVETSYVDSVQEGPDSERVIERLARGGCGLVFTTSFGFMDPTLKVAGKFPNVKFEHMSGYKTAPNMSTYNLRWYQGRYVQGEIAAKVSKSGTAGYIVSFPIPEVVMGIDAFMLGAQSVNPNFKVKIVWVNTWLDPGKEADAAKALVDKGADVLVQHTDSPAAMQIAEERHIHAFGQSADMLKFGPHAQLASLVDNWGPYYIKEVNAVLDGSWKMHQTWAGMADNDVLVEPLKNMPDDVKKMAEGTIADIKSGKLVVFSGPVYKQDGTLVTKPGEVMPDKDIDSINFYVKGITEKLPGK
ncbi:MAG: BMP family ABC transporter substrate-binding protein [Pseudolabrys sp.]